MKTPFPLVTIVWDDAETTHGWEHEEEITEPKERLVQTVGFLVKEGPSHYLVASSVDSEGNCNCRVQIPKGMVKEFKVGTPRKKREVPKNTTEAGAAPST